MATATKARQQLTRGDRLPNLYLPDQRGVVINTNDKARGGPIFVLLYPSQTDPHCTAELESLFALAPQMLADGAHLRQPHRRIDRLQFVTRQPDRLVVHHGPSPGDELGPC